jgi:hypothetical protein
MQLLVDNFTDCDSVAVTRSFCASVSAEETLLFLANGREQAFGSGGFQPVIDLLYENFVVELRHHPGSLQDRLIRVAGSIKSAMAQTFPFSTPVYWGEVAYSGVFIAVVIKDPHATPIWIGSPQAKLYRNNRCVNSTNPHVYADPSGFVVTTQSVSSCNGFSVDKVQVGVPWKLQEGDFLVLADYRVFSLIPDDRIAELLVQEKVRPAKVLVEQSQGIRYQVSQSALTARVGKR